jgi:hypothetical protein
MYLGIDQQSGLAYEGIGMSTLPIVPTPSVTQAKLIKSEEDWNDLPFGNCTFSDVMDFLRGYI